MGGSSGLILGNDIAMLEQRAKQELAKSKPNIFISFAHEDINLIQLFRGQSSNTDTTLNFSDYSVKQPYNSRNAEYIKLKIRERIKLSSTTIVMLSNNSSRSAWVNWEIKESLAQGKGVIGISLEKIPTKNLPVYFRKYDLKIVPWNHELIMKAIQDCRNN